MNLCLIRDRERTDVPNENPLSPECLPGVANGRYRCKKVRAGAAVKMLLYPPVMLYTGAGALVFIAYLAVWLVTACSNQYGTCSENA